MPCSAFSNSNSIWRMVAVGVSRSSLPNPPPPHACTAGAAGFLNLSQSGDRPER